MRINGDGTLIASNNGTSTVNIGIFKGGAVTVVSLIIDFDAQMFEWHYDGTKKGSWSLTTAGFPSSTWPLHPAFMSGKRLFLES
jgi:hypothetical protein